MSNESATAADRDAEQLRALGYVSHFDRTMSLWENFALGFTYLSLVVGVYTIFATTFAAGGPPMWWTYLLVAIGQMMVCLVFGEIVSQFPISGGLYPWARRLLGKRWAWMTGWVYGWALFVTLAAIATGAAPFFAQLLGIEGTPSVDTVIAVALIALVTWLNLSGTRLLARMAVFGFACELIGAIVVGSYLLLFARHQPLSVLMEPGKLTAAGGSYWPAFLASALGAMFCYYGFEACGDVAEETPDASVKIPKAMRLTIYVGGAAALWVCLGLVLSVPDIDAVLSGRDKDPVVTILRSAVGDVGFRVVIAIVLVSFVSALLSLQAASSRLLYAYARDDMIVGSRGLKHLSRHHVPANALLLAGAIPTVIALAAPWLQDAIATIVSFASIGIYIAFQMVVLAALVARSRGWRPAGAFTLGPLGGLVNVLALAYGIGAIINMAWPRAPQDPWYSNYGMLVTTAGVLALGTLYMVAAKPYDRGQAPAGDAHHFSRARAVVSDE